MITNHVTSVDVGFFVLRLFCKRVNPAVVLNAQSTETTRRMDSCESADLSCVTMGSYNRRNVYGRKSIAVCQ